jgi:mutator protein MutT
MIDKKQSAIDVGVACIHRDGEYLICKRPSVRGGEWEFPGGKREPGENIRSCLKREIREEIKLDVTVSSPFLIHEYQDGARRWRLHFCRCKISAGTPRRTEHTALKWITPQELRSHPFPTANRKAVLRLLRMH